MLMDVLGLSGEDIDKLGMYEFQSYLNYSAIQFFSNKTIKDKKGVSDKSEESLEFPQPEGWNLEPPKKGGVL